MQMPVSEMRAMSLWQFTACLAGWNRAQKGDEADNELGFDDIASLSEFIDAPPVWKH
jgi:hypothetical protein